MKSARISNLRLRGCCRLDIDGYPLHTGGTSRQGEDDIEVQALGGQLSDLQERLFAEGRSGERRSVLVVLQGRDTSGRAAPSST